MYIQAIVGQDSGKCWTNVWLAIKVVIVGKMTKQFPLCQLFLGKNEAMESDGAKCWSQAHGKRISSNKTRADFQNRIVDIADSWYDSKSKN